MECTPELKGPDSGEGGPGCEPPKTSTQAIIPDGLPTTEPKPGASTLPRADGYITPSLASPDVPGMCPMGQPRHLPCRSRSLRPSQVGSERASRGARDHMRAQSASNHGCWKLAGGRGARQRCKGAKPRQRSHAERLEKHAHPSDGRGSRVRAWSL